MGGIGLEKKKVTIASIDVVEMYLSIKFPLVNKAISYFTRNLPNNQQYTITLCLKLVSFGTSSTLPKFRYKYFEYGEKGIETKGLEIGRY